MSREILDPINSAIDIAQLVIHTDPDAESRDAVPDFPRLDAGRMVLSREPFCPRQVMAGALAGFTWEAQEKSISLGCEIAPGVPRMISGDAVRLGQILLTLLGNAMRFTEKGDISLDVSLATGPGVTLHFVVRDTGIGIAPEIREQILRLPAPADTQAVIQSDASAQRQGGTGHRLAICSTLVELMQGRIWVESVPGRGSAFHFTASFDSCPDQSPPTPVEQPVVSAFDRR
jgi:hypothetical protein